MNLYVWAHPWPVSYGSSLIVAVAESEEAARAEIARGGMYPYGDGRRDNLARHVDMDKLGAPSRIIPVPCAEGYEWAE